MRPVPLLSLSGDVWRVLDSYGEYDIMILSIKWHPDTAGILKAHAGLGILQAKEVGRVIKLVQDAAGGGWRQFSVIDEALTQGKALRTFEAGSVVVIVQVMPPVALRVVEVGIDLTDQQWPQFVATAAAKV